jgi:hypothetical protein
MFNFPVFANVQFGSLVSRDNAMALGSRVGLPSRDYRCLLREHSPRFSQIHASSGHLDAVQNIGSLRQ